MEYFIGFFLDCLTMLHNNINTQYYRCHYIFQQKNFLCYLVDAKISDWNVYL